MGIDFVQERLTSEKKKNKSEKSYDVKRGKSIMDHSQDFNFGKSLDSYTTLSLQIDRKLRGIV